MRRLLGFGGDIGRPSINPTWFKASQPFMCVSLGVLAHIAGWMGIKRPSFTSGDFRGMSR